MYLFLFVFIYVEFLYINCRMEYAGIKSINFEHLNVFNFAEIVRCKCNNPTQSVPRLLHQ